jgi:glutamine cyclotransferase
MAYRLKMADGTTQAVVQAGERFELGDRVQVTPDGRLLRP